MNRWDEGLKALRVVLIENGHKAGHIDDGVQSEIVKFDSQRSACVNVVCHSLLSVKQAKRGHCRFLGTVAVTLNGLMGAFNFRSTLLCAMPHDVIVGPNGGLRISTHQDATFFEDHNLVARRPDLIKIMRDDQQRLAGGAKGLQSIQTFLMEP